MKWRDGLKATAERVFACSGLPALWRFSRRGGVLIVAYHNVVPDGVTIGGDSSLHLPRAAFASQLDLLHDTYDVIPLETALLGLAAPGRRPKAVITFDDAYRGAMTVGIREVVDRGLPATVFVPPAFVGGHFFWWDALMPREAPDAPADTFRARALNECRGMDEVVRRRAEACGCQTQALPDAAACASLEELRAAAAEPGITLASHSWSHPNLPRLTAAELETELARPLVWLRERFDRVLPVVSYPYGLSSPAVEEAAAAAGYKAGVLVSGGWVPAQLRDLFALPRLNVPAGLSRSGFVLRTSGLLNQ